jgi:hypothetical protein
VDALEAIAEVTRGRELRGLVARLAAARGVSAEAAQRHFERLRGEAARLRAAGLTDDEVLAHRAARMGIAPEELRRRGRALAAQLASQEGEAVG